MAVQVMPGSATMPGGKLSATVLTITASLAALSILSVTAILHGREIRNWISG